MRDRKKSIVHFKLLEKTAVGSLGGIRVTNPSLLVI